MKNWLLILFSLLLVVTHVMFATVSRNSAKRDLEESVHTWAQNRESLFNLVLEEKATSMQQIATYVGNDPEIRRRFLGALHALEANDGDYDAPDVRAVRDALYDSVKSSWDVMRSEYDVRQLHFHFGPGSNSFLRVHRPQKYGDNMDTVRYTIVDANQLHRPTKGFETGRVYSGIRGVVPVTAVDPSTGKEVHVGALEAGTSFSFLLNMLHARMMTHFAALLTGEHVRKNMWDEFVATKFSAEDRVGSFFVEDSTGSSSQTQRIFSNFCETFGSVPETRNSGILEQDGQCYQVACFPLRDYRGNLNPELPAVGVMLVWENVTSKCAVLKSRTRVIIFFAVISLVLLEGLLLTGWHFGSRRFRRIIREQTAELELLATRDRLTGLFNRWKLEEYFTREISRHHRYGTEFSVIMFDLDHFKVVNDTWGHDAGDKVLREVSDRTSAMIRKTDILARWGGEEFVLLLPHTDLKLAKALAERIRISIGENRITDEIAITVSLGVVQHNQGETMDEAIKRADDSLYQAKNTGRNKVWAG